MRQPSRPFRAYSPVQFRWPRGSPTLPGPLLIARVIGVAQLVSSSDVYILGFHEEVLCGYVNKMDGQVGPFPSVSWPLAYSPEALSTTRAWGNRSGVC